MIALPKPEDVLQNLHKDEINAFSVKSTPNNPFESKDQKLKRLLETREKIAEAVRKEIEINITR